MIEHESMMYHHTGDYQNIMPASGVYYQAQPPLAQENQPLISENGSLPTMDMYSEHPLPASQQYQQQYLQPFDSLYVTQSVMYQNHDSGSSELPPINASHGMSVGGGSELHHQLLSSHTQAQVQPVGIPQQHTISAAYLPTSYPFTSTLAYISNNAMFLPQTGYSGHPAPPMQNPGYLGAAFTTEPSSVGGIAPTSLPGYQGISSAANPGYPGDINNVYSPASEPSPKMGPGLLSGGLDTAGSSISSSSSSSFIPSGHIGDFMLSNSARAVRKHPSLLDQLKARPLVWNQMSNSKKGCYKCSHCDINFNNLLDFAQHLDMYDIRRNHLCPVDDCPWSVIGLPRKAELRRHCVLQHFLRGKVKDESEEGVVDPETKQQMVKLLYSCSETHCGKHFYRKDSLQRHLRLVHKNQDSKFNRKWNKRR